MKRKTKIVVIVGMLVILGGAILIKFHGYFFYQTDLALHTGIKSYQEELIAMVQTDPATAFLKFRQILKEDPLAYATCHGLAHQMGHNAHEAFGFAQAMHYQDAICGGGYIHGVIESEFGALQEKDLISEATSVCGHDEMCLHGIGHGLMIATDSDVPKSIEICTAISESEKTNCYDGVFMHIFDQEETGIPKSSILEEKALEICRDTTHAASESCYYYLPRIYPYEEKDKEVALCNALPKSESKNACVLGYGVMRMKYAPTFDQAIAEEDCNIFDEELYQDLCRSGIERYKALQEMGIGTQ